MANRGGPFLGVPFAPACEQVLRDVSVVSLDASRFAAEGRAAALAALSMQPYSCSPIADTDPIRSADPSGRRTVCAALRSLALPVSAAGQESRVPGQLFGARLSRVNRL